MKRLMSELVSAILKFKVEVLAGDQPDDVLYMRYLQVMDLRNQVRSHYGLDPIKPSREHFDEWVREIRENYDIFYIDGRIKIAKRHTQLWEEYKRKQERGF